MTTTMGNRDAPDALCKSLLRYCIVVVCVILLGLAYFISGPSGAQLDQENYCKMVAQHAWPDFHHSFTQECNPNGSVKEDQP